MLEDRNKTELTKDVTAAVVVYLDCHGFKPVETEVPVQAGWTADVAGVIDPTRTELVGLRLMPRKPDYRHPAEREEWEREALRFFRLMTALVEVKTSRSDFLSDRKWSASSPCNLSYVALPASLNVADSEVPAGWGILRNSGSGMHLSRVPGLRDVTVEQQLFTVMGIALKRDHATRYARQREYLRRERLERSERIVLARMSKIMRAVTVITQGRYGSVRECLEYYGIRGASEDNLSELGKLWASSPDARKL